MVRELLAEELLRLRRDGVLGPAAGSPAPRIGKRWFRSAVIPRLSFVARLAMILKDGRPVRKSNTEQLDLSPRECPEWPPVRAVAPSSSAAPQPELGQNRAGHRFRTAD